jgi:hypothetical protein
VIPLSYADILRWFDGDDEKAQIFNPHINRVARQGKMDLPKGVVFSVMKEKEELVRAEFSDLQKLKEARSQRLTAPTSVNGKTATN